MELRGTRYLRPGNKGLSEWIASDLHYLEYNETLDFYTDFLTRGLLDADYALLACNDRFFLLTHLLRRPDALHPWLFARTREVEADPDGYLDLWARFHYKSTIITFAGIIQEIICNPEIRVGIFSHTRPIALQFLRQIKQECEQNPKLPNYFPDVFWAVPRTQAPMWSEAEGITVKRTGNPKEATVEAWGLTDGMPTSKHYDLMDFDDVVTKKSVTNAIQIEKTTHAFQLADNLATVEGSRKWVPGTRYSYADTYGTLLEAGSLKPRIYPATHNGKADGDPVLMTPQRLMEVRRDQKMTFAAQMLQNPTAGLESMFQMSWCKSYTVRPSILNVYIMGDPASSKKAGSDRTAIIVVGVDAAENFYLLDGYRHRMNLTERWSALYTMWRKWDNMPGVQMVKVGWERYGAQTDTEHFEAEMRREGIWFDIKELNWTRDGNESKTDRVSRLVPDLELGNFFFPAFVWHPEHGGRSTWTVDPDTQEIVYKNAKGETKQEKVMKFQEEAHRVPVPIRRRDEDNRVYDLTRALFEEIVLFPFGQKDDGVDAMSRVHDMEIKAPVAFESAKIEVFDQPDA